MEQLYQNVMALWHQLHVNMKSVVSWHYLQKDVRTVSSWSLDTVRLPAALHHYIPSCFQFTLSQALFAPQIDSVRPQIG